MAEKGEETSASSRWWSHNEVEDSSKKIDAMARAWQSTAGNGAKRAGKPTKARVFGDYVRSGNVWRARGDREERVHVIASGKGVLGASTF